MFYRAKNQALDTLARLIIRFYPFLKLTEKRTPKIVFYEAKIFGRIYPVKSQLLE